MQLWTLTLLGQALERHQRVILPRSDVVPSSHFKDEEAECGETTAQGPKMWGVGFNLVFLTLEAIVFSCSLLKCQNNCQS